MSKQVPPKSRLGRGLSSLMNLSAPAQVELPAPGAASMAPGVSTEAGTSLPPGIRVLELPIDQISVNPHQPRRRFNEQGLKELADSLRTTGLIQPIVARSTAEGGYELIAGERRWRAAKIAGIAALPVIVRSVDPVMQAQMALVENLQREDLNPIDRATAYKALLDNLGLTQAELADRLGEERSVIGHFMRFLDLTPAVQELLIDGKLTAGHAKVLAGVPHGTEQERLANLAISQGLSIRNLERLVDSPAPAPVPAEPLKPSAHMMDLEKSLSRQLGMRIQVRQGKKRGKGRVILHFASLDQFDDLMAKLGVSTD